MPIRICYACIGSKVVWFMGRVDRVCGFNGFMVSWCQWFHGFVVSWFHGLIGFLVSLVTWTVTGFIVLLVSWFHSFYGFMVSLV